MIRILQGNLNRSKTDDDLLMPLIKEAKILIISKQYQDRYSPTWFADTLGTAAIWIPDSGKVSDDTNGSRNRFVWVRSKSITYVSCYLISSESILDFQEKLHRLEDVIRGEEGKVLVSGNFNVRAVERGIPKPDSRGNRVMEMSARTGLVVINKGRTATCRRPGQEGMIPDITLATESLAPLIQSWEVIEDYTESDHQYISLKLGRTPQITRHFRKQLGWNTAKMDEKQLNSVIAEGKEALFALHDSGEQASGVDTLVDATMQLIHRACDAPMPRNRTRNNRRNNYWMDG